VGPAFSVGFYVACFIFASCQWEEEEGRRGKRWG
jgi:hypothetical protein